MIAIQAANWNENSVWAELEQISFKHYILGKDHSSASTRCHPFASRQGDMHSGHKRLTTLI